MHIKRRYRDRSHSKNAQKVDSNRRRESASSGDDSYAGSPGPDSPERHGALRDPFTTLRAQPDLRLPALQAADSDHFAVNRLDYQWSPATVAYPSPALDIGSSFDHGSNQVQQVDSYFAYPLAPRRVHSLEACRPDVLPPSPAGTPLPSPSHTEVRSLSSLHPPLPFCSTATDALLDVPLSKHLPYPSDLHYPNNIPYSSNLPYTNTFPYSNSLLFSPHYQL